VIGELEVLLGVAGEKAKVMNGGMLREVVAAVVGEVVQGGGAQMRPTGYGIGGGGGAGAGGVGGAGFGGAMEGTYTRGGSATTCGTA